MISYLNINSTLQYFKIILEIFQNCIGSFFLTKTFRNAHPRRSHTSAFEESEINVLLHKISKCQHIENILRWCQGAYNTNVILIRVSTGLCVNMISDFFVLEILASCNYRKFRNISFNKIVNIKLILLDLKRRIKGNVICTIPMKIFVV